MRLLSLEEKIDIKKRFLAGEPKEVLSKEYGVSIYHIERTASGRKDTSLQRLDRGKVMELISKGSLTSVAKELGFSLPNTMYIIKRLGLCQGKYKKTREYCIKQQREGRG